MIVFVNPRSLPLNTLERVDLTETSYSLLSEDESDARVTIYLLKSEGFIE